MHDITRKVTLFQTERLEVRQLADTDAPAYFAIFPHPEVMRYWSEPAWTSLAQAEVSLRDVYDGYANGNWMRWGIERKSDSALIGTLSLFHFHHPSRRAEIGYALGRPFWGQGYMNEALTGLVTVAFATLGLNRLEADVDPRNEASAKTLERLGFQKEGVMPERWIVADEVSDTWWYGLLRRHWEEIRR